VQDVFLITGATQFMTTPGCVVMQQRRWWVKQQSRYTPKSYVSPLAEQRRCLRGLGDLSHISGVKNTKFNN
jgi:hypothetical protein